MIQLGIDEAGRGPVLGPLVMAGLTADDAGQARLAALGVADSKAFGSGVNAQTKRAALAQILIQEFPFHIVSFSPAEVDAAVQTQGLNRLEQQGARQIMQGLTWDQAVLDGKNLFRPLENGQVTAKNKADQDFLVVAAASILAKDARDRALDALFVPFVAEFGSVRGGGYPNGATLEFVWWHQRRFGDLPGFYRRSYQWSALAGKS